MVPVRAKMCLTNISEIRLSQYNCIPYIPFIKMLLAIHTNLLVSNVNMRQERNIGNAITRESTNSSVNVKKAYCALVSYL